MAPPLYFLPGLTRRQLAAGGKLSRALLHERGLADVYADVQLADLHLSDVTGRGPGEKSGLILVAGSGDGQATNYRPASQEWEPVDEGLWIGLSKVAEPPGPEDLIRKRPVEGYTHELADGRSWTMPVIRRPDGGTQLPRAIGWDEHGDFVQTVRPEYRQLWADTAKVVALFVDEGSEYELSWGLDFAIRCLAVNYRYDKALHNRLHLVGSEHLEVIFGAAIDLPLMKRLAAEAQKKSESGAGQPLTNGAPGVPVC